MNDVVLQLTEDRRPKTEERPAQTFGLRSPVYQLLLNLPSQYQRLISLELSLSINTNRS